MPISEWKFLKGREVIRMKKLFKFLKGEEGATATEYAVMLALIIVVSILAITALGVNVNAVFTNIAANILP
jgi:pilus assembly protein Flp/PilA